MVSTSMLVSQRVLESMKVWQSREPGKETKRISCPLQVIFVDFFGEPPKETRSGSLVRLIGMWTL